MTPASEFYTAREVATLWRVSVKTIARWAADGKIPSVRTPGGQRRFPRTAIDTHLHDATHPATD